MEGKEKALSIANEWTKEPFDVETQNEVKNLIASGNDKELIDRFGSMLEFGTGGMRGVVGAGTNRMNRYMIAQASQGLANYVLKNKPAEAELAIAIAYDSRLFSREFAEESAAVFAGNGIKAYIFKDLRPTPELSFTARYLKCSAGVVVTASHNPKEYNGYKVYWSDGGQVVPPHDKGIIKEVTSIKSISDVKKYDYAKGVKDGRIVILGEEIDTEFIKALHKCIINPELIKSRGKDLKIVFTPLHGTGGQVAPQALADWGFSDIILQKEQSIPDGNFPTLKSPNPEESAALTMAIELARSNDADIVLATDPDADRVGIAVKTSKGEYTLLNGNQVGALLAYYILSQLTILGRFPKNAAIVKTIVTTELIKAVADKYSCALVDVLTGFKYIGEQIRLWESSDAMEAKQFVFGTEESYGYLIGTHARDKDAIVTCCVISEMTLWAKTQDMNLVELLDKLFAELGLFLESQKSVTLKGLDGMSRIKRIMQSLEQNPPSEIMGKKVISVDNINKGIRFDAICKKEIAKINLPKSNVMVFYLDDKSKIVARPSGTEPKIKYYFFIEDRQSLPVKSADLPARKKALADKMEAIKKAFSDIVDKIE